MILHWIRTIILFISFAIIVTNNTHAQVDVIAPKKFSFTQDGNDISIPYYATHSLSEIDENISKIIIVVHGTNRNADDYFDNMTSALNQRPELIEHTLIIAPQFLRIDDVQTFNVDESIAYWSSDGWKVGSNSKNESHNPRDFRIPSYEVLDSMISILPLQFPNAKQLVFTGHSAGGQLTNRYTASNPIFDLICSEYGISTKSIVANPGSYVYLSPMRRIGESLTDFGVPTGCSDYNEYSYGLDGLYTYHSRAGAEQMKDWYRQREVIYLVGEADNDPNASTLPRSCRAMLQGSHRLERSLIYYNHIIETFSEDLTNLHKLIKVPGVGHNNFDMYHSESGLKELFDKPPVNSCGNQTTSTNNIDESDLIIFPNPVINNLHISSSYLEYSPAFIYNNLGQIILQFHNNDNAIDVSALQSGLYYLQLNLPNKSLITPFHKL